MSDVFELTIDGVAWQVASIQGHEALGEPFSFDLTARPESDQTAEIGAAATLTLVKEDGSVRTIEGLVDRVTSHPGGITDRKETRGRTDIRIVPNIAPLADTVDHAVFLDQDALQIAEAVLTAHQIQVEKRCQRTLDKRAQCVQAFESDLTFVTRILAEEGIVWFLHPEKANVVVVVDHAAGFEPLPGDPLAVRPSEGLASGRSVWGVALSERAVPDKVTLRDFDFEAPSLDLTAEAKVDQGASERYEYRGRYTDPSVGKKLAQIRLEEHRRDRVVLRAITNSRELVPGGTITLEEGPLDAVNTTWVITRVTHSGGNRSGVTSSGGTTYQATFEAVPKDNGYRPARSAANPGTLTSRPGFGGVQTMDVTGSSGAEIHTEQYGRSKARFRWERTRPNDDTASAWFRSVQPPTSGGFFLARVGWQVLSTFYQGSPDEPLELGRLYTGTDIPPQGLPGKKVCSDFVSRTTPGGGSVNGLQMNDTAGNEGMTFTASKDFNERTENDKTTTVTSNDTWTIGANRTTVVTKVFSQGVGGAQTYTVGGSRTVNVDANKAIQAASESITIGAARIMDIGGDNQTQSSSLSRLVGAAKTVAAIEHQSQLVTGPATILVGGTWAQLAGLSAAVDVGGANVETVAGAKSIKCLTYGLSVKGAFAENYASKKVESGTDTLDAASSRASIRAGGSINIKGADVVFTAQTKIQIKAGGVTVKITPGSVTITGKFKSSQSAKDDSNESYD
ncbi:MAG: type VI secretion system tip protein VgrG [Polyangiaceae bacterium]|nr:type VI secretion system tip protein VgrG [Polyangiaceae bacterium]